MTKCEQTIIAIADTSRANGRVPPGTSNQRERNQRGRWPLGQGDWASPVDTNSTTEEAFIEEARPKQKRRFIAGLFVIVALVLGALLAATSWSTSVVRGPGAAGDVNRSLSVPYACAYVVPTAPGALGIGHNGNLFVADDTRNQILERLGNGHSSSWLAVANKAFRVTFL